MSWVPVGKVVDVKTNKGIEKWILIRIGYSDESYAVATGFDGNELSIVYVMRTVEGIECYKDNDLGNSGRR